MFIVRVSKDTATKTELDNDEATNADGSGNDIAMVIALRSCYS